MKFGQLKIGAAFDFDGDTYIKTSPVIGQCQKNQTQKFFRRAVDVVCGNSSANVKQASQSRSLPYPEVAEAFAAFYRHCEQCLQDLEPQLDAQRLHSVRGLLDNAKQEFLTKIS